MRQQQAVALSRKARGTPFWAGLGRVGVAKWVGGASKSF